MTAHQNRKPTKLMLVLGLFALIAAACGGTETVTTPQNASELSILAPEPVIEIGKAEPLAVESTDSTDVELADGEVTEQYASTQSAGHGLTLEEWGQNNGSSGSGDAPIGPGVEAIAWSDLIPAGMSSEDIYERFEERLLEVEFGSDEAEALYVEMEDAFDTEAVNPDLDGQKIRLAGFVAPLTYDNEVVTEFLLVPNFGACIHVPPPPPNQTVMVSVDRDNGLTTDEAWGAVWVEGTLTLDAAATELAPASYTITDATSGVYTDF